MDENQGLPGLHSNLLLLITREQDLARQDRQLAKLAYADNAAFNSGHREHEPHCASGTRVNLLRELQEWSMDPGKPIFWLNGMAGTGKSTIARTVAQKFLDQKRLRASFFFSRGTGDLGHAGKFVTTVAYQLARSCPLLTQNICEAIDQNGDIIRQGGLRSQWKELILGPLTKLAAHQTLGLTLVVDALDECDHEQDIKTILQLFVEAKDVTTLDLKIFVTSRPETPIRIGFRDMPEIIYQDLALHHISRSIVEKDISVYLRYELEKVRKDRDLPSQWPGEENIKLLIQKSDCIFIYVATACLFVRDQDWHPDEQLSIILQDDTIGDSPTAKLDSMYTQVLKHSVFKNKEGKERAKLSVRFKKIAGSIVVLFNVLPAEGLAILLSMSKEQVGVALSSLHSVLNIPENEDDPIRLLHPSFRDFLLDGQRCRDVDVKIEQEAVHENLTESCLRLLSKTLTRDICALQMLGTRVRDVQTAQIDFYLPKEVQYACSYWVAHLGTISHHRLAEIGLLQDGGPIHKFFLEHFLHWLEALSLIGKISEGVLMITKLESLLEVSPFNLVWNDMNHLLSQCSAGSVLRLA